MAKKKIAKRSNPQSAEFWEGYRTGEAEILLFGIEAFEARYALEFEENDTNDFKGRKKALERAKSRLSEMLKGGL